MHFANQSDCLNDETLLLMHQILYKKYNLIVKTGSTVLSLQQPFLLRHDHR